MPESPIGSIIAYAGEIDRVWEAANGWMHCDGRQLNRRAPDYAALFDAIRFAWGGDGRNMFSIPDLQGFFLRGVYGASDYLTPVPFQVDPDRNERIQIRPGGNQGDKVGSVQSFGTALPTAKGSEIQIQPAGGTSIGCPSICTPRAT
jgi:Phage Tail Collar Domain